MVEVDAAAIAESCGSPQSQNIVVLGALAASGVLPFKKAHFPTAFQLRLPPVAQETAARAFAAGKAEHCNPTVACRDLT